MCVWCLGGAELRRRLKVWTECGRSLRVRLLAPTCLFRIFFFKFYKGMNWVFYTRHKLNNLGSNFRIEFNFRISTCVNLHVWNIRAHRLVFILNLSWKITFTHLNAYLSHPQLCRNNFISLFDHPWLLALNDILNNVISVSVGATRSSCISLRYHPSWVGREKKLSFLY